MFSLRMRIKSKTHGHEEQVFAVSNFSIQRQTRRCKSGTRPPPKLMLIRRVSGKITQLSGPGPRVSTPRSCQIREKECAEEKRASYVGVLVVEKRSGREQRPERERVCEHTIWPCSCASKIPPPIPICKGNLC
jgi:hypothetical protein